jgi:CDP-6-deoxy-D-xylo-4-hexulose-3-dehydrase
LLATFLTHTLGFSALPAAYPGQLIEDCCEALGGTFDGKRLGTFGLASNFSFYYAHHMTTVEGGMICTNDRAFYESCRMLRAHGLLRECSDEDYRMKVEQSFPDLDPQFIFVMAGYNMRPTEIQAVLGRSQLKRLDANVAARTANLHAFLASLDPARYRMRYRLVGSSNYALPLILQEKDSLLMGRVLGLLQAEGVEYRRGTAGGGNQLRQPYLRKVYGDLHTQFPQAEHVHDFGLYIGNYPGISIDSIGDLCQKLNAL